MAKPTKHGEKWRIRWIDEKGIHFHSLRHTFVCHWRLNSGSLDDLIRVLDHTSRAMTGHYANIGGYHRPEHFSLFAPVARV